MLYLAARHLAQAKSRWLGRMEGKVSSMMEQHLKLLRTPARPAMDGSTSSALQHFNAEGRLKDCKADHWRVARLMGKTERISKPRPPKPSTTKAEKAPRSTWGRPKEVGIGGRGAEARPIGRSSNSGQVKTRQSRRARWMDMRRNKRGLEPTKKKRKKKKKKKEKKRKKEKKKKKKEKKKKNTKKRRK